MLEKLLNVLATWLIAPTLVTTLVLLLQRFNQWWENHKRQRSYIAIREKDTRIQELLAELRIRLKADRAYVSLYHNGNHYYDGSSDVKKSRTHEVVAMGTSYAAQNYQDIRVSLIPEELEMVNQNGDPVFKFSQTDIPDGKFKRQVISEGVFALIRCPIRSNKNLIGFVGLDFCDDRACCPEDLNIVRHYADQIENILSRQ